MRSARHLVPAVVVVGIATQVVCGGNERPDPKAALARDRLVHAVPTSPSHPAVRKIDVGGHPGPIASADGALWVTVNEGRGRSRLVRVDMDDNRVVASSALAGGLFEVAAGEGAVWVSGNFDDGDDVLYRLDTGTNRVAATIPFPGRYAGPVAVGEGAVWVVLTDRGRTSSSLARIDPATNRVERIARLDATQGRYVDELAAGNGAVWLLALRLGETGELPGDVIRVDPASSEVAAVIGAEALNMGLGPGGLWITGCVDCGDHRDTFFAQEIDTAANAPVGPRFAVDHVGFGPLLVSTDSVWFSGYGAEGQTVAFRLDPDVHALRPYVELGDYLHTGVVLDERGDALWVASPPHSVIRVDLP